LELGVQKLWKKENQENGGTAEHNGVQRRKRTIMELVLMICEVGRLAIVLQLIAIKREIVIEGVNKANHPIQNPLLRISHGLRTRENIISLREIAFYLTTDRVRIGVCKVCLVSSHKQFSLITTIPRQNETCADFPSIPTSIHLSLIFLVTSLFHIYGVSLVFSLYMLCTNCVK
jgi:hypothetical protein